MTTLEAVLEVEALPSLVEVEAVGGIRSAEAPAPSLAIVASSQVSEVEAISPVGEVPALASVREMIALVPVTEMSAFAPVAEVGALAPVDEVLAFTPVSEVDALRPFNGDFADPASLWVQKFIMGGQPGGFPTFVRTARSPRLYADVFGSPTLAQNFIAVLSGLDREGQAIESGQDNLDDDTQAALHTSTGLQFPAGSKVRLWIKTPGAVYGSGGVGGDGNCVKGEKVNSERMGGGGGGAGLQVFHLSDPGDRVGGRAGLNQCSPLGGPHGEPGKREAGGLGNDLLLTPASNNRFASDGFVADDAIELQDDLDIFNEGKIYGGGGGGGGAQSDGIGNESFPGDGGGPGEVGQNATTRDGNPPLKQGGAAGLAVKKNGNTLTFLAGPYTDTAGPMGDVRGAIT